MNVSGMMYSSFDLKPKRLQRIDIAVPILSEGSVYTMFSWSWLCVQGPCPAGARLGFFVPVKGSYNATAYKNITFIIITVSF